MKGSKMLTTLVTLSVLLSAMFVITTLNKNSIASASAVPGVDVYGNATTDFTYGQTIQGNLYIYTAGLDSLTTYYLHYPIYNYSGTTYNLTWSDKIPAGVGNYFYITTGASPNAAGATAQIYPDVSPLYLNISGLWVFSKDGVTPKGQNPDNFTNTIKKWFWVNASTDYIISGPGDFYYGENGSRTITVTGTNGDFAYIDVRNPQDTTVKHRLIGSSPSIDFNDYGNITMAGNYTVSAYRDNDSTQISYGGSDVYGYNTSYGSNPAVTADYYNYSLCGPWDPPEINNTNANTIFKVKTNTQAGMIVTNTSGGVYWGYALNIELNVTDKNNDGITGGTVSLRKSDGTQTIFNGTYTKIWINETGKGNYTIQIPRVDAGGNWSNISNSSYYIVFAKNVGSADVEEWNTTYSFSVSGAPPPVRLVVTDDGDSSTGSATDMKINTQNYVSGSQVYTRNISFVIYGTQIGGNMGYYGDQAWENRHNITVTGDILYPVNDSTLTCSGNTWTAKVIPTRPGGTISIWVDWPGSDNGSTAANPAVINIINGTTVTASADSFVAGQDFNLTVTVNDMTTGDPEGFAKVYLIWDGKATLMNLNSTTGDGVTSGKGADGKYTFWIKPSDQLTTAPQNITIAAEKETPNFNFWGYAKVEMTKDSDLWVNCTSSTTAYAGDPQTYNLTVLVGGTTVPATYSDITVAVYDTNGTLISDITPQVGEYTITDWQVILPKGTYQFYAYNNTHSSEGNNATITVTPYTVTCVPGLTDTIITKDVIAWLIDTSVNLTFQITPAVSGTLKLNNMSSTPNCSDVGVSPMQIYVTDGLATLNSVNATDLGNVTYQFMPNSGSFEDADGLLHITTATATPTPGTIYINEPTNVVITVTHPATGKAISGVRVGLDHGMDINASVLSKLPSDAFTDSNGQVTFAITSQASGNVTIYINNGTDSNNPYVIISASRKTMVITTDPSVNELDAFTVYARDSGGNLITDETVSVTFNGNTTTTDTGILQLTAPSVQVTLDYKITATAPGYTNTDTSIKVINKPMIFMSAPTTANSKESFTVTAGGDDGNSYGIIITIIDNSTGTTVATGTTAGPSGLSFSLNKGTYIITATKDGYTAATPVTITVSDKSTPGFELLTLIIAIGVALILLRRRK